MGHSFIHLTFFWCRFGVRQYRTCWGKNKSVRRVLRKLWYNLIELSEGLRKLRRKAKPSWKSSLSKGMCEGTTSPFLLQTLAEFSLPVLPSGLFHALDFPLKIWVHTGGISSHPWGPFLPAQPQLFRVTFLSSLTTQGLLLHHMRMTWGDSSFWIWVQEKVISLK